MMRVERSQSRAGTQRRGSIMTLFVVLVFALLPLMALVIHTGFVTLTRRQMQTAVNTAAKEGLRIEQSGGSRSEVSTLVSLVFDDDLHIENIASDELDSRDMVLGAGPSLTLTDGTPISGSTFRASSLVSSVNDAHYPSGLKPNPSNQVHGDMVAGEWVPNAPTHLEGPYDDDDPNLDLLPYERHDFFHASSPDYSETDAFLVRLRRTNNSGGLDEDDGPDAGDDLDDVSSRGTPVPYLFGRVPYGNEDGGTSLLDQRERGTIVRATAIAQTGPAVSVGRMFTTPQIEGLTNVVVDSDFWAGNAWTLTADPDESEVTVTVNAMSSEIQHNSMTIGRLVAASTEALTIGELTAPISDAVAGTVPSEGIVIIRAQVDRASSSDTDLRIVGFGYLRLVNPGGMPNEYTLTRRDRFLPTWNTASMFTSTEHLQSTQPVPVDVSDLMAKHLDATLNPTLVRAPALVRTID